MHFFFKICALFQYFGIDQGLREPGQELYYLVDLGDHLVFGISIQGAKKEAMFCTFI